MMGKMPKRQDDAFLDSPSFVNDLMEEQRHLCLTKHLDLMVYVDVF